MASWKEIAAKHLKSGSSLKAASAEYHRQKGGAAMAYGKGRKSNPSNKLLTYGAVALGVWYFLLRKPAPSSTPKP